jgi:hypothetical protein
MPGQVPPRNQIDPENSKLDERGRPIPTKDTGRESDPIPSKVHREHKPGDELEEAELGGDDLAELAEDPLKNAEGPDV